jgi:hypothetical protein
MTRRRRTVYAYDVTDLRTGQIAEQAYIGKTARPLQCRDREHREGRAGTPPKVWSGHIVGGIYPLWQADCGPFRAWYMEIWFIVTREPLFNVEWNKRNRHRIPPWTAKALYGPPGTAYGGQRVDVRSTR